MKEKLRVFFIRREMIPYYLITVFAVLAAVFFCCFLSEKKKAEDTAIAHEIEKEELIREGKLYYTDPAIAETAIGFLTTAFTKDESFQKMRENCMPYTASESVLYYFFPEDSYDERIIPEVVLSDFTDTTVQTDNKTARCHLRCAKKVTADGMTLSYTMQVTFDLSKIEDRWQITGMAGLISY